MQNAGKVLTPHNSHQDWLVLQRRVAKEMPQRGIGSRNQTRDMKAFLSWIHAACFGMPTAAQANNDPTAFQNLGSVSTTSSCGYGYLSCHHSVTLRVVCCGIKLFDSQSLTNI